LINNGYYAEALDAYTRATTELKAYQVEQIVQTFGQSIAEIQELKQSDNAYARDVKLGEEGYTFLPLLKTTFTFDKVMGRLEKLKLRCSRKFSELPFLEDSDYQIPESWGDCQLQIIGKKGSSARLIQQ
jgi:hypothetical protein